MRKNNGRLVPKLKLTLLICSWIFLGSSCEKTVQFHLNNESAKLVVEGSIETGKHPVVKLSKSIGFFSKVDLQTLINNYVHNAVITVSDGQHTVTLKEYHNPQNPEAFYYYTVDTSNLQAMQFVGEPGKNYFLQIQYNGQNYTSETAIPFPKPLDSVWAVAPPPEEMPKNYPNSRLLYVQYTDPDTPGNRIRYFTKRNSGPFLPPLFSVYDDEIINGKTIQIQMPAGFQKMDTINRETFGYFYKGDTVVVKWCAIDQGVYNFWETLEYSYNSVGNPFASPVEISTNIKGGALGVWAGYGATFDTLIIRH